MTDLADVVERALSPPTYEEFDERVEKQADRLRATLADGDLENDGYSVGLEVEVFGVTAATAREPRDGNDVGGRLARLPEAVFDSSINGELGLHNAELNTTATTFDESGLEAQASALRRQLATADRLAGSTVEIALDGMWGVPAPGGTEAYLSATRTEGDVVVAENMKQVPRYVTLDNEALRLAGGALPFSVPGVEGTFPSILLESVATSIQPHLQIPDPEQIPAYHNVATRTMAPLLAVTANSPFLPGDLYGEVADPHALLEETHHELRIAAFEQSMNQTDSPKVRVPDDLERPADVVDAVVTDPSFAPFLSEWVRDEPVDDEPDFAERFWEFDHKRGTFWRWVRAVVGGDAVAGACDQRSVRLEYRPLPTQPTVRDLVSVLALTTGLLRGLVAADHPLATLEWDRAREGFYDVVESGLDAEIPWVTAEGERTTDQTEIYAEVFRFARQGLLEQGVAEATADTYLAPIEARWEARTAPSDWKKARVRERLDAGEDLQAAIAATQQEYVRRSTEFESFAAWL